MQVRAIKKLESERGASLMVALLLFLVCTIVASIVLVAGTASAGRLSQLREADQRYYSVTSAAELIRDKFPQTAVITRTHSYTQLVTTEFSADPDSPLSNEGEPGSPSVKDSTYSEATVEAFNKSNQKVVDTSSTMGKSWVESIVSWYNSDKKGNWDKALFEAADSGGLTLITPLTLNVKDNESLDVKVEPTLRSDGSIILKLYNASGDDKYYLTMVLSAEVQEDEEQKETNVQTSITASDAKISETVTSDIEDKKISTIVWTVTDVLSGEVIL